MLEELNEEEVGTWFSNSGPIFTRVMRTALSSISRERSSTFEHDLSIHSKNFLEHLESWQLVFDSSVTSK